MRSDPDLLRGFVEIAGLLARADEVLARPGVFDEGARCGRDAGGAGTGTVARPSSSSSSAPRHDRQRSARGRPGPVRRDAPGRVRARAARPGPGPAADRPFRRDRQQHHLRGARRHARVLGLLPDRRPGVGPGTGDGLGRRHRVHPSRRRRRRSVLRLVPDGPLRRPHRQRHRRRTPRRRRPPPGARPRLPQLRGHHPRPDVPVAARPGTSSATPRTATRCCGACSSPASSPTPSSPTPTTTAPTPSSSSRPRPRPRSGSRSAQPSAASTG